MNFFSSLIVLNCVRFHSCESCSGHSKETNLCCCGSSSESTF